MAVDLSKLIVRNKITLQQLSGKTIAIDAYNVLYQFLSIIRQPDGTPLTDSNGMVTSHLSGLFYRSIELIESGITPIYVFDGIPSKLKMRTIEARMSRRAKAYESWQQAKERGALEEARTYAQQSTHVDKAIVSSSKELLDLMGIAYMTASGEGEAQASVMCANNLVYAAASQDYDTLLFGSPRVVRNLTLSGRRKLPGKNVYISIDTELVELEETLKAIGITRRQLIWIGIMLGNDFNEGIKGVGPKTALKIAMNAKSLEDVEREITSRFKEGFQTDVKEVEDLFLNPEVSDIGAVELSKMTSKRPDPERLVSFMSGEHGFLEGRIRKFAEALAKKRSAAKQPGISGWM